MGNLTDAAIQIDGHMDVVWAAATPPITRHYLFSCLVENNGWRIVTRQEDDQTLGHRERAKHGTNLFHVQYVNSPIMTNKLVPVIRAHGRVLPDNENAIPYFTEDFSHVLWLAYCRQLSSSSQFHGSQISSRILRGTNMPPTNFVCTASWHPNDAFALEKLDVFHPGVVFDMSGRAYPLSAPLDKGYVAGRFEGRDFTNAG